MQRCSRYTIGNRIENKFLDLLEVSYTTYFIGKDKKLEKLEKISECIFILDKLKFLISVAWEGKIIANSHYKEIALKLDEVGRMLGGWKNNLENPQKKNRAL